MTYQIQVSGNWAGSVGDWRPAIDGTLNQTGGSPEDASTFDSIDEAREVLDHVVRPELPEDDVRTNRPRFRIRDLESGVCETA